MTGTNERDAFERARVTRTHPHTRSILNAASSRPKSRSKIAPCGEMKSPSLHTTWSASNSITPRLSFVGMPFFRSVGSRVCSIKPPCAPCTGPFSIVTVSGATAPVRARCAAEERSFRSLILQLAKDAEPQRAQHLYVSLRPLHERLARHIRHQAVMMGLESEAADEAAGDEPAPLA